MNIKKPYFEEVSQNTKEQHENAQQITLAMEQLTESSFQIADSIEYTNDALIDILPRVPRGIPTLTGGFFCFYECQLDLP